MLQGLFKHPQRILVITPGSGKQEGCLELIQHGHINKNRGKATIEQLTGKGQGCKDCIIPSERTNAKQFTKQKEGTDKRMEG